MDKPIITAINGLCVTCGFEMVMGSQIRIASENATFQMLEARLGIMPQSGANVFLPAQVGYARAMEILLTGNKFSAATLYEWGLLNRLVPEKKLMDETMSIAEIIAGNGPKAISGIVRCARKIRGKTLQDAIEIEYKIANPVFLSEDVHEGINALRERRIPEFS